MDASGCHNSCGMLYYMKDGKLDHAEGDPLFPYNKGRLCARCLNLVEAGYHEERLRYPMIRKREDRGNIEAFERITWEEALDIIRNYVVEEIDGKGYGRESIFGMVGTGRNICWQVPWIINNAFGSPNTFCALFSGIRALFRARLRRLRLWAATPFPIWANSANP